VRASIAVLAAGTALVAGCGSSAGKPEAPSAPPGVKRAAAAPDAQLKRLIALGKPVYCGGGKGDAVALTFDDGPGPYTHFALKRLRRNHQRATFFLVSRNIPTFGSLVAREKPFGEIGNHTRTHPFLPALGHAARNSEIVGAQKAIARASGSPVRLFRPPYGGRNHQIDDIAKSHGMLEVLWNVDSADSLGANYAQIYKNVVAGLHPGSIILMHENRGQTIRALPPILHALKRRHLRAVTVPELMELDPPSRALLRKGLKGCPHYREVGAVLNARGPG
jgi:peptidoglycan/xylan/chitin deacetylase (PgdA/CDA1 family)